MLIPEIKFFLMCFVKSTTYGDEPQTITELKTDIKSVIS